MLQEFLGIEDKADDDILHNRDERLKKINKQIDVMVNTITNALGNRPRTISDIPDFSTHLVYTDGRDRLDSIQSDTSDMVFNQPSNVKTAGVDVVDGNDTAKIVVDKDDKTEDTVDDNDKAIKEVVDGDDTTKEVLDGDDTKKANKNWL